MAWVLLVTAGLLEIGFALAMKQSAGFQNLVPTLVFIAFSVMSMVVLNLAVKTLPIGTAYAVWTGIGAVGTAVVGMVALGEKAAVLRISGIALIVVGAVVLQLADSR
jgi:quaternary ammonium compound-resistance protein SugE